MCWLQVAVKWMDYHSFAMVFYVLPVPPKTLNSDECCGSSPSLWVTSWVWNMGGHTTKIHKTKLEIGGSFPVSAWVSMECFGDSSSYWSYGGSSRTTYPHSYKKPRDPRVKLKNDFPKLFDMVKPCNHDEPPQSTFALRGCMWNSF